MLGGIGEIFHGIIKKFNLSVKIIEFKSNSII